MPAARQRRLVIDSDVTGAAGDEDSDNATAANCHRFLVTVLTCEHYIVRTPEIKDEWRRHRSGFSYRWLFRMHARKLVIDLNIGTNQSLREKLSRHVTDEALLEEMLKDAHLLEGAIVTDRIVASRNNSERDLFRGVSRRIGEIRDIMWVNPDTESEYCLDWLSHGAQIDPKRQLGYQHRNR